jgi:hypothetical protein
VQYLDNLDRRIRGGSLAETGKFEANLPRTHLRFPGVELPSPELYILKLVQASVALGAEAIRISILENQLQFVADGCTLPDPFDLASCLMTFPKPGSALADLTIGLSGGLLSSNGRVDALTCQRGERQYVVLSNREFKHYKEPIKGTVERKAFVVRVHKNRPSLFTRLIGRHLSERMDEHRALYARATLCPINITLDGRNLEEFEPIYQLDGSTQLRCCPPQSGELGFRLRPSDQVSSESLRQDVSKVQGSIAVVNDSSDPTQVYWVRRGVLLQCTTEDLGPKIAIVCADRLGTDNTEFGLLRNDDFQARLQSIRTSVS